jgi:hypothetical protein
VHTAEVNVPVEIELVSDRDRPDPFNEIDVDVVFAAPSGEEWRLPAFWDGGRVFRARFAPPATGEYTFRSICTDATDGGLHGATGTIDAKAYGESDRGDKGFTVVLTVAGRQSSPLPPTPAYAGHRPPSHPCSTGFRCWRTVNVWRASAERGLGSNL